MSHLERVLADSADRDSWLLARANKIGASDAAKFSKIASAPSYAKGKLYNPFQGNAATAHGNKREAAILAPLGFEQNTLLFHAEANPRHVCTPDGIKVGPDGALLLAEAKTTNKPWKSIPVGYIRQCQWAMHVLEADCDALIWEVHDNFIPTDLEPESVLIHRDDAQIKTLILIADRVLDILDAANEFTKELDV